MDRETGKKYMQSQKAVRLWPRTITEAAHQATSHFARYTFALKFVTGKDVCDVACGAGYGSSVLAQSANKVIGMDSSAEAIKWASRYFSEDNVKFLVADALEPWPVKCKFDVVVSFETMEHLRSPDVFLGYVHDHLLSNGILILSVPNGPRDRERTDNPHHLHHFSKVDLKILLEKYFPKVEYFSQAYRKDIKHYGTKLLRKVKLLRKQPYFLSNYFLVPRLRNDLKTWFVIACK